MVGVMRRLINAFVEGMSSVAMANEDDWMWLASRDLSAPITPGTPPAAHPGPAPALSEGCPYCATGRAASAGAAEPMNHRVAVVPVGEKRVDEVMAR